MEIKIHGYKLEGVKNEIKINWHNTPTEASWSRFSGARPYSSRREVGHIIRKIIVLCGFATSSRMLLIKKCEKPEYVLDLMQV